MPIELAFSDCLDLHVRRYPDMQIQDLVKLAYQAAFAGGHLIDDAAAALDRLRQEYDALVLLETSTPASQCASCGTAWSDRLLEPIGNGLSRLHLRYLPSSGLALETAGRVFILTANGRRGDPAIMAQLIAILDQAISQGLPLKTRICPSDWQNFMLTYRQQGCPSVHHSETYRLAYRPAYRVVRADLAWFGPVLAAIDQLLRCRDRIAVAIDGNSGAGKSTLANLLHELYGGNLFHMDDFFLPPQRKTPERLATPGGNVDYERFEAEVIRGLSAAESFAYRAYDCRTGRLGDPRAVRPDRFNLVEGSYSLHPVLRQAYDLKIMLRIDPERQRRRIQERSGEVMLTRFLDEWIPLENHYLSALAIDRSCDLILDA